MTTYNSDLPGICDPGGGGKPRALFYVFDGGSGIGHLRRLSRIAAAMQDRFSCLVVSGHAASEWIVPPGCEYVRLPSWDSMVASRAQYWGRVPFLEVSVEEAADVRREIIHGIVRGFRPDVFFVDHLPLGAFAELASIIESAPCRKYLVTRGVQNETEDLDRLIFGGAALASLQNNYARIFSAIDPEIFDLSARYDFPEAISEKIHSVGYVAPTESAQSRAATRTSRRIPCDAAWVVASAGSGQWGEPLIEKCVALAGQQTDAYFDIVMGPRSRLIPDDNIEHVTGGRVRVHASCENLADLHAACDVVITCGGYNSLLESLRGQARILCFPYRTDQRDEPFVHASLLARKVDLQVAACADSLPEMLAAAIASCRQGAAQDRRLELKMNGAQEIARVVLSDVGSPTLPV